MPRPPEPVLSRREEAAVRAYLATGSVKAAAHLLGLAESTVGNLLATARRRIGVETTAQVVAKLGWRL